MDQITNTRDRLDLTGPWRFVPDPHGDGESHGFWQRDHDFRLWGEVGVPSCFEAGCPDMDFYEGICWYRRSFSIPGDWKERRIVLRFEGVNYRARVWLNGVFLGENRDGFLPFEFEIQDATRWDEENALVVSVDNSHHEGDVPGMHVGWRGYGGILREVAIYTTDPLHVESLRVIASPGNRGGDMEFRVRIRNGRRAQADCTIEANVFDPKGNACAQLHAKPVAVSVETTAEVRLTAALPEAQPWSPATPVLYEARIGIKDNERTVDETVTRFGFRRIEATADGLLLNGEPIFLTGFNRHEDSPRKAMAADLETTRRDLEAMKEAGANYVRLCHYPHHPGELDLCDELGLLVFAEVPLYFWNDAEEGRRTNPSRVKTAARQMERMIERDFNHPSIVFWSVSNETHESDPEVAESNRELIRAAREHDSTRLHVHVSNHWTTHPNFEEDDVICVNHYPGIDWRRFGHDPASFDHRESAESWRTNLAAIRFKYPDKPVLVTEFGYASFPGTRGHSFGEDEHARVISHEFAALDAPFVCGATIWCWADHPWPSGRFLGGLTTSPFGVVSRDRRKLDPYRAAQTSFRSKQDMDPIRPVADNHGTSVAMERPHMNGIPQVPFPDGYGIRPMTVDDVGLWTDIQRDAERHIEITTGLFRQEFGDDLEALSRRCFIVTGPRGLGIGTISAWYNRNYHGRDYGRIHWVAMRPASQGKGIGKAALTYAMNQLAQWHERCYLRTSIERVAAIALYLNFGFEPDLDPPDARRRWEELAKNLKHPALERALA